MLNRLKNYLSDYYDRLMNLPGRIHDVAVGFAIGVFFAFSPWLGLHTALVFLFTLLFRKSFAAGLLGSLIFNPLTGLPILLLEFDLGKWLLRPGPISFPRNLEFNLSGLKQLWALSFEVMKTLLAGSLVVGSVAAVASYFLVRGLLQAYRAKVYLKRHP